MSFHPFIFTSSTPHPTISSYMHTLSITALNCSETDYVANIWDFLGNYNFSSASSFAFAVRSTSQHFPSTCWFLFRQAGDLRSQRVNEWTLLSLFMYFLPRQPCFFDRPSSIISSTRLHEAKTSIDLWHDALISHWCYWPLLAVSWEEMVRWDNDDAAPLYMLLFFIGNVYKQQMEDDGRNQLKSITQYDKLKIRESTHVIGSFTQQLSLTWLESNIQFSRNFTRLK